MRRIVFSSLAAGALLVPGWLAWLTCPLAAQQPVDPFGGPAAAPQPGKPAKGSQVETDPVVLAIRAANPSSPVQLAEALRAMMDYGRLDEARRYLQALADRRLSPADLADLEERLGSGFLLRLKRTAELQPLGQQFSAAVMAASQRHARDPNRLQLLVDQLRNADPAVRARAMAGLRSAGAAAVGPLVRVLGDARRAGEHARIRSALVLLKQDALGPLWGAVQTPDSGQRVQIMDVLGQLGSDRAVKYLVGPAVSATDAGQRAAAGRALEQLIGAVPTRSQVQQFLRRRVAAYLQGELVDQPDVNNQIVLWSWDAAAGVPVARRLPSEHASLLVASRLASDLVQIAADRPEDRQLYLLILLESAKRLAGWQPLQPGAGSLHDRVAAAGAAEVEAVLDDAIRQGYAAAATGAVEVLANIGDAQLVVSRDGQPRPLVRALQHSDRRLRFAAVMAILKLDPQHPYAGSSLVPETLGYLARTLGSRRALIVHPRTEKAQTLAGLLGALGYDADTAQTGHLALQQGARQPDYEFILINQAIDRPAYRELVQRLRQDLRTARLPMAVLVNAPWPTEVDRLPFLVRDDLEALVEDQELAVEVEREMPDEELRRAVQEQLPQIKTLADPRSRWSIRLFVESDPLTIAFPTPHSVESLSFLSRQLRALSGRQLSPRERLDQAAAALDQLSRLAEQRERYSFYNLLRQEPAGLDALQVPELTAAATGLLAQLATPRAQRALVDVASANARPLAQRQAAADSFAGAVRRRHLLLSKREILQQYDRYNRSAALDRETQQVLGSLLDTIEAPTRPPDDEDAAAEAAGP